MANSDSDPHSTWYAPAFRHKASLTKKKIIRFYTQLGPLRIIVTTLVLLLSLLFARFSWHIPLVVDIERVLFDIRATLTAPRVDQDERIVMITYTDETLFASGIRSPVDRTILEKALANIDQMGAKTIGIDIVFDSPRPDDLLLQARLRAMQTPTWLAYVEQESNPNTIQYQQQQFLQNYVGAVHTAKTRPASVRFQTDDDGTIRSWPNRPPGLPPLMPSAMTDNKNTDKQMSVYEGSIRFLLPRRAVRGEEETVFAKVPIDSFALPMNEEMHTALGALVQDRHVLIGSDIIDIDRFETPLSRLPDLQSNERKTMVGIEVQAHMLAQQLDNAWLIPIESTVLWIFALLMVITGSLTALVNMPMRWTSQALLVQLILILSLPFNFHSQGFDTASLSVFGWAFGWLISYAVAGATSRTIGARQRAFAQSALGKYLPRDVAAQIINNPKRLSLHGEKREVYSVFSDLQGFTTLSHAVTPETVASLLNEYLDRLSDIVLHYGGTIDKFVGDAVVAFWGAPISRSDDGKRAAAAAYAMFEAGEKFRHDMKLREGIPLIGKTRVGLHKGDAIVGNFGGKGRIQYTALGDSINTAARLESANKEMKTNVLFSREACEHSDRDDLVAMGRVTLRGRAKPVDVFEPRPDLSLEMREAITKMIQARKNGDHQTYVTYITTMRSKMEYDPAIKFLLHRLNETKGEESYALH